MGQKKSTSCDKCFYTSTSHWNIKIHNLYIHSTIEERKATKYYCETCDNVFLCSVYYGFFITFNATSLNIYKKLYIIL